jgi:DMSO/TMAO reductase YedYZ molybdopterin-dependent catalytic subunit
MKQLVLALVIMLIGCAPILPPSGITDLPPSEVDYYNGVLSPAYDGDNSIKGVQAIDIELWRLEIFGLVEVPLILDYQQVLDRQHYARQVTLHCVDGWSVDFYWQGVLIPDLLAEAGVLEEAAVVIFHAHDGYTTSIPLTEVVERQMLLAHMANGSVLTPRWGFPFTVVAQDKLGYKWARWVTGIELSSDLNYKGFWEQRGFNNDADIY